MHTLSWQHLKTGYSERTLFEQDQTSDSSSSLGFAIDCLNSSHLKGNLLFIDVRNRTDQRRIFEEERKKEKAKDVLAELKRKAKDTIDAEMAQLEKRWQCSCLRAFANQCCKGLLMRLLPLNAQLRFRRESTRKQITKDADKKKKKLDDRDKRQLDDEEKTAKEKTDKEKKVQAKRILLQEDEALKAKLIGEKRIWEAKIEWLTDCKTIMHAHRDADKAKDPTADPTGKREQQEKLNDIENGLRAAGGARACDTLDVCTVAFFMAVCSME